MKTVWETIYRNARLSRPDRRGQNSIMRTEAVRMMTQAIRWGRVLNQRPNPKEMEEAVRLLLRTEKADLGGVRVDVVDRLQLFAESCNPRRRAFVPVVTKCPETGMVYATAKSRYIATDGLAALVQAGIEKFEGKHGKCFPHNFVFSEWGRRFWLMDPSSPDWYEGEGRFVSPEGADRLLMRCGRIGGWLATAADLPALTRVITRSQSRRGVNSPRTTINLWELWEKYPSPHRLERILWRVRHRAEKILSAWEHGGEYHPAWADIADALLKTESVGKAAIISTAATLAHKHPGFHNYAEAREWLASIRGGAFPVLDSADGVAARREAEPRLSRPGISVYRARFRERYGRYHVGWMVRSDTGRSYHADDPYGWFGAQDALREALGAWKAQEKLTAEYGDIVSFLMGEELGFCPLITLKDSLAAGNCRIGTESWARAHGWDGRQFLPGPALIPHLNEEPVRRAVLAARRHRTEEVVS